MYHRPFNPAGARAPSGSDAPPPGPAAADARPPALERARGRHPLSFMPFGIGQRQCVGKEFALLEGQLILARILQRFRLSAVPGRTPRMDVAATLRTAGGVWLGLAPRPGR
ncbi:cytochrome P450 [Sorangium sp. So ce1128]